MKFDKFGCLIREKYTPEFHPGNIGDSCYYTGHYAVLSRNPVVSFEAFKASPVGYVRHPELPAQVDWGSPAKFSGDQFVPMVLGTLIQNRPLASIRINGNEWLIPGTKTLLTPAAWCLIRGHYRLLNILNWIQGIILKFPFRYNDQKYWFERTSESSVDYLNMVLVWTFLKTKGHWGSLGATKEKCREMVLVYYQTGGDSEPNSDWFVDYYFKALSME